MSSRAWDACSRPLCAASALTNANYHLAAADLIAKYFYRSSSNLYAVDRFATDHLMAYILLYRTTMLALHSRRIAPKLDRYLFKAGAYYATRKNWDMVQKNEDIIVIRKIDIFLPFSPKFNRYGNASPTSRTQTCSVQPSSSSTAYGICWKNMLKEVHSPGHRGGN